MLVRVNKMYGTKNNVNDDDDNNDNGSSDYRQVMSFQVIFCLL